MELILFQQELPSNTHTHTEVFNCASKIRALALITNTLAKPDILWRYHLYDTAFICRGIQVV